jgi:hypothetical protein
VEGKEFSALVLSRTLRGRGGAVAGHHGIELPRGRIHFRVREGGRSTYGCLRRGEGLTWRMPFSLLARVGRQHCERASKNAQFSSRF